MYKIYFTLVDKDDELETISISKEGNLEEVEVYANSYADDYLNDFPELVEVNWNIVSEISNGIKRR